MYRLLLITDPSYISETDGWSAQKYDPVDRYTDIDDALKQHQKKPYDAIGVGDERTYAALTERLSRDHDSTPCFILPPPGEERTAALSDVRHLLHRLHADYTDADYTLTETSRLVQQEMLHNLLAGTLGDADKLSRWFKMLRSPIPLKNSCRVYALSLPFGELYLADTWHHGQLRLQKALERNFFGHIADLAYCAVAFRSPSEARLLLIPAGAVNEDVLDSAVLQSVNEIKAYLDLDIDVIEAGSAACVTDIAISTN